MSKKLVGVVGMCVGALPSTFSCPAVPTSALSLPYRCIVER